MPYVLLLSLAIGLSFLGCSNASFEGGSRSSGKKDNQTNSSDGSGGNADASDGGLDSDGFADGSTDGDEDGFGQDPKDGDGFDNVNDTDTEGNANVVWEDSESGIRHEKFIVGEDRKQDLVDYLFVMDNSCSMGEIITKTTAGFAEVVNSSDDVFPKKSRISVMSTMPADPNDLSKALTDSYNGVEKEPGFLALVDEDRIASYRNDVPSKAKKWKLDGCDAWFEPSEKNANGDSCLTAHTQQSYECINHEAGATALAQFMEKQGNKRTFRKGAIVNVIFVSDTHDPGSKNKDLLASRPDADKLIEAIEESNSVAGVKFHALAPESACTGEGMYDLFYYDLVGFTQGVKADPCKTNDYTKPIADIVESSSTVENPKFVLSKPAKKIIAVYVDGKKYSKYDLASDDQSITLKSIVTDAEVEIRVVYEYK
jgi:hypothetical protein